MPTGSGQWPKTTYPRVGAGTAAAGQGYRTWPRLRRATPTRPGAWTGSLRWGWRCNLKSNINLRLVQRCQVPVATIKDCVVVRWCPAMLHFMSLCQNTRHYCHTGCIMNARSSDSSYASTCACVGHTFLAINSSTTLSCGFRRAEGGMPAAM